MDDVSTSGTSPGPSLADSRAFREATLRSEVRRVYAVVGVMLLAVGLILLPNTQRQLDADVKIIGIIGIMLILAVQVAVLSIVRWARNRGTILPGWFAIVTVIFESLIPTGMMFAHFAVSRLPPYAVMNSPPYLAYFLLISLTTLRLRPSLCILAGAVSAAGYAAALVYVRYGMNIAEPTTGLPQAAYVNTSLLIFISGMAAAWVARELRGHFEAALGEAEMRHHIARIEQDLSIARSIQQALLPRTVPNIPGFDIAGWNRSADQTGGDYYDWQSLPDGNWIVTLADVSGHGIGPAMVTAACRAYVRASSLYHADLPSLASRINRLLSEDLPEGRFVTMASVLIDAGGGPLRLLSAGHGPIVLCVGSAREIQDVMPQHMPLAVARDMDFGPAQSIALAPGDVLALVTDGFIEWARPDGHGQREEFGMSRLRESLRCHAHLPALAMIEAVAADVATFAGGQPQQDDLTMVIIRRVG